MRLVKLNSLLENVDHRLAERYGEEIDFRCLNCEAIAVEEDSTTRYLSKERIEEWWRTSARDNFLHNLVEINDYRKDPISQSENLLANVFDNSSRIIPTVIKYVRRDQKRALAVLIPEGLPFSTFLKEVEKLSTAHNDFFKPPSIGVGRPAKKSTYDRRAKIEELKKQRKSDKEIAIILEGANLKTGKDLERAKDRIRKQRYKTKNKMS